MKTDMDVINEAVRRHGLHKLSSRVLAAEGLPVPQDWSFGEVAATMGAKIAQDLINHDEVMGGISSLYEVAGDSGEKLARVDLFEEFSRVKNVRETVGKTASESAERELIGYEIGFWQRCKNAAANDHEGQHIGLAKIALSLYVATDTAGEKLASSVDDAVQFAASFASAAVIDSAIASMVKSAEVTPAEGMKLAAINAQAAINDLKVLTKSAGAKDPLSFIKKAPLAANTNSAVRKARKFPSPPPNDGTPRIYAVHPSVNDAVKRHVDAGEMSPGQGSQFLRDAKKNYTHVGPTGGLFMRANKQSFGPSPNKR